MTTSLRHPPEHIRVTRRLVTEDPDGGIAALTQRDAVLTLPPEWTTRQMVEHLEALGCTRTDNLQTDDGLPDYP